MPSIKDFTYPTLEARFWKYVQKTDRCWLWTGHRNQRGYGLIGAGGKGGKTIQVHRYSFMKHVGDIPNGLLVCHHCDTPLCVRPDHLFLGTAAQNTQDAIAKGRMSIGEANPKAVIDEATALAIRKAYREYPMSPNGKRKRNGVGPAMTEMFGLPWHIISDVINRRSWPHLPDESIVTEHYEPATA